MKTFITFILLCLTINVTAQVNIQQEEPRFSVRNRAAKVPNLVTPSTHTDSLTTKTVLYKAGNKLKASANYQYAALGGFAASGIMLACYDKRKETKNLVKTGAIIFAVAAVFCEYKAIELKFKAGNELQIGAGSIVYKF